MTIKDLDLNLAPDEENLHLDNVPELRSLEGIEGFPKLKNVTISNSRLSDIEALQYLPDIESLELPNNQIQDISVLAKLPKINYLNLTNNQIVNANPIIQLPELSDLYIDGNELQDVDELFIYLRDNENLWTVYLLGFELYKA